ncbi:MAG: PPOX class F420-dependent oxidoreductase [Chloroflexota bacterium]
MDDRLQQFNGQPFLNLESFRKNGQGVKTPVWFIQDGEVIYVRTVANSGKVKRVRHNGNIHIFPCEANGNPTGEWVQAQAVEVTDQKTAELVARLLENKYGEERVRQFGQATAARGDTYTVLKIERR